MKINPFKPNSPVPTAMFAGRYEEIILLEKGVFQTKNGHATNFLVSGERGIGKSSLLMYLNHMSRGEITSPGLDKFNFVTISLLISERTDLISLVKLIEQNISREIGKIERVRKFLTDTWSFAQRLKIMDSGICKEENDNSEEDIILDEFSYSLAKTCYRITNPEHDERQKDGIVFFIDEVDNASEKLHIGYFFKTVTELLQQYECNNTMFVIAGLPNVIEKLRKSHESSIRIFNQIKIKELSPEDRKYVVKKGLESGNSVNEEQTTISEKALQGISTLSEGYPHFIQQFAYSAFDHNSDGEISNEDVIASAFKNGGALDAIGSRYYYSFFHDKIKSDEYRQVLCIMAEKMNLWIKKKEIREQFTGDDKTLSNALATLTSRKIILKNPSKLGEYRLQHKGFALWIKLFGERQNDITKVSS